MLLTILWILTGLAVGWVLLTLIMGAKAMGGKTAETRVASNKWMQRRVFGQFVAIGLLFLTLYVKNGGA
ncbi:HIG1 domain-containing protein [Fretibacter rubidus]|uniref:HIG1 domain-containing protein n=1 Tax=Fretibacter rubidus TaxID=570162 RepID=UPI00352A0B35